MTTAKRFLAASLAVFTIILLTAGGAWLLVDDATLVKWLAKRVESASGTQISYRDDATITRSLSPALSLNKLVIKDVKGKYRFETQSLLLQISLPHLLTGRVDISRLLMGDTHVNVNKTSAAKTPDSAAAIDLSALRLQPVLHDVQISEISLLIEGKKLQLPAAKIKELTMQLGVGKGTPQLSAKIELQGEPFTIDVTLPELQKALKRKQLPFSIAVKGAGITESSAVGQIDLSQSDAIIEASLRILSADLNKLPPIVEGLEIPGELLASGSLAGTFSQLALEDVSMTWNGPGQSTATLQGRIASVSDFSGVDLELLGQLGKADWLQPILPKSMAPIVTGELAAKVSGNASKLNLRGVSVKARTSDELNLFLAGELAIANLFSAPQAENLNLDFQYNAPTTHAARALFFEKIPEFGAVTAAGQFRSTRGTPRLENIVIQARDDKGITAYLKGSIAQFPIVAGKSIKGFALDTVIKATQTSLMAERVGLKLPLSGPLDLAFRIEGDTQALQLNQIRLAAGSDDKTFIGARGRMDFGNWDQKDPLNSIDLMLEQRGRDTAFLSAWAEQNFPITAYEARGRLHTVAGQHRLDDFTQGAPAGELLNITETGWIDSVVFFPKFDLEGIHIDVKAKADDAANLNTFFKMDDTIPAIGPLELSFRYTGTEDKLFLSDFSLTAGQQDVMRVTAKGRLGYISAAKKWHLKDTDLVISAISTSSQTFANVLGFHIPQLGPISATASLNDKDKTLGLKSIRLLVGNSNSPVLSVEGHVGDIYSTSKVKLDVKLNLDGHRFAAFADKEVLPDLKPVTGSMVISDNNGSLGIDSLHVKSSDPASLILNLQGSFDDFTNPETMLFKGYLIARDLQLLGALLDQQWTHTSPVKVKAEIKQVDNDLALDANLMLGKGTTDIKLRGDFDRNTPYISGAVTAQNFFFMRPVDKAAEKRKTRQKKNSPVFSSEPTAFSWLKKADLDLTVDIESFDKDQWDAQSAKLVIALKSGLLAVKPAIFTYTKGTMELELQIDTRDVPTIALKATAEDVNPWRKERSEDLKHENFLGADYDLELSLNATGKSAHDLASSMEGDIYMTVQNGWLRRSLVDMLFVDLAGWSFNFVKGSKYAPIYCGIADYSISKGILSTNAFFIDSKSITIAGEGTIDLGKEEVDYMIIPRKKSRFVLKAEPVKIKGPLGNPSVKVVPVRSAALTFGTLIFAPYIFAGLVATDVASGTIQNDEGGMSACIEYEEKHHKERQDKGK